jgi:hypothetical protein
MQLLRGALSRHALAGSRQDLTTARSGRDINKVLASNRLDRNASRAQRSVSATN